MLQQANQNTTVGNTGNAITKVFYSTAVLAPSTGNYPMFQKLAAEIFGADTNMQQPGTFTESTSFFASHLTMSITSPRAAAGVVMTDIGFSCFMNWAETTTLQLLINNIEWCFLPLVSLLGTFNIAVTAAATNYTNPLGASMPSHFFPLKTKGYDGIDFASKMNFIWNMTTNDITMQSALITGLRLKLQMLGTYTYAK